MKAFGLSLLAVFFSFASFAALPPITGTTWVCQGSTTTLGNTVTGGTWTSGSTTVASIGITSGVVTGIAAGTSEITYTNGIDFAYTVITVNPLPAAVAGPSSVCLGASVTLSCTPAGGGWISANPSVAPVSSTGVATGVSLGTTIVSYQLSTGCASTIVLTVTPTLPPITGAYDLCEGHTSTLHNATTGGVWTSSAPAVVSVGSSSGITNAISAGSAVISYSTSSCTAYLGVSVNPSPGAISGAFINCLGSASTLTSSPGSGTWSSSAPGVASIAAATGTYTAVGTGTATISYSLGICYATAVVTANAAPTSIAGTAAICAGSSATLSAGGVGGSWTSSNPSVATVDGSGLVFGTGVGTSSITYTAGSCGSASRTVTVSSSCAGTPVPGIITPATATVCSGAALVLNLPAYSATCGQVAQWQYSTDGLSWSNIPGAHTVPYTYYPTANYYYRCSITCVSSGMTAYSGPAHVFVNFQIGSHSVLDTPSATCDPSHFYVEACGVSAAFDVITAFGDGTFDTTALSAANPSFAHILHDYAMPGTYTVRHILRNGGVAVDTVAFTYVRRACNLLPIGYYYDANSNCVFDAGDSLNLAPVLTRVDSAGVPVDTISATAGFNYKAVGAPGTVYAFHPLSISGGLAVICPAGTTIYDTISATTVTYAPKYFGIRCGTSTDFDLEVTSVARTGRHSQVFDINVTNFYCTPVSPVVTLTFSPEYGYYPSYAYSSPAPSSVIGNTITWNLASLAANATRTISVHLERVGATPAWLTPGDTIHSSILVYPFTGDVNTGNNSNIRIDTVRASFDPNGMEVEPAGYILPCTDIQYRVRFENTGNDTAHNIAVIDTLPVGIDPSSIEIVASSHPMNLAILSSGGYYIAKFDFPSVNLADTSHHEACYGMFAFNAKTLGALADGTILMNRAGIYFDENEAVMTNSVFNTIGIAPIVGDSNICLGSPDTLMCSTYGGAWASSATATATITPLGIANGVIAGTATISYTIANSCTVRTATKDMTVNPVVAPAVTIVPSVPDTVCLGSAVSFAGAPTAGGPVPVYTWSVNGFTVSTVDTFTYTPLVGDTVSVYMLSNQACTVPGYARDTLPLTVIPTATPSAAISVSSGDTACAGVPVTFTATPSYGGGAPGYQWYVNTVLAGTGPSYTYLPVNGDAIYCRMGSNFICRLADTITTSTVHMTVDPVYIPVVSLYASPGLTVVTGDNITFTASVTGAGPVPTYQWIVNSAIIAGETNNTYTTNTLADYDSVSCYVTGSGACHITSYNSVFVTILPVGVPSISGRINVSVSPNPSSSGFRVRGTVSSVAQTINLTLTNVLGQEVVSDVASVNSGAIDAWMQLPGNIAPGIYVLRVGDGEDARLFRLVVSR